MQIKQIKTIVVTYKPQHTCRGIFHQDCAFLALLDSVEGQNKFSRKPFSGCNFVE